MADQARDATVGAVSTQIDTLLGRPTETAFPNNQPQFEAEWQRREATIRSQERLYAQQKQEEIRIFDERKRQTRFQIQAVRTELEGLIASIGQISQDVDTAIQQEIANPGVYHLNFFERLIKKLARFKDSINKSHSWLVRTNERASLRQGYWRQVKKSGTKYLLSHERAVATQTG